jgi:hypothetical protein
MADPDAYTFEEISAEAFKALPGHVRQMNAVLYKFSEGGEIVGREVFIDYALPSVYFRAVRKEPQHG